MKDMCLRKSKEGVKIYDWFDSVSPEGEEEVDDKTKDAQRAARGRDEDGRGGSRWKRRNTGTSESTKREEKDGKRKEEKTEARRMTYRSCRWTLSCCVRRTCRSCGRALSRVWRVPGSHRRTSWPIFYREYRTREKRETVNEIVGESLGIFYRLERTCWAHCWLSVDWDVLCARRSISRTVTPLGTFHTADRMYPSGRKLPPQRTDGECRGRLRYYPPHNGPHTLITRILIPAVPPRYRSPPAFPLVSTHGSCTPI